MRSPTWHGTADAWFKLLAAIAIGYVILAQAVAILKFFAEVGIIAIGGVLLAYFVYPAVSWLNRRLPLWLALAIVYVAGLIAIAMVFYLLVPAALTQLEAFARDLPRIQHSSLAFFQPSNPFLRHLPPRVQQWFAHLPVRVAGSLQRSAGSYTVGVVDALKTLTAIGIAVVGIPVVSIYMLAEASAIKRFFVSAFTPRWRTTVVDVLRDVDLVIGGFVRGQMVVAIVVGTLSTIALLVLHVPYAFVIGAWAGLMDVIPYVGPFAGGIPAFAVALVCNGAGDALGVVAAFVAINQLEGHVLGPCIVSSTTKLTPLAVVFAILIAAQIFGLWGVLVAVPLAGIVRVALVRVLQRGRVTNAQLKPGLTHAPRVEVDPRSTKA